MVDEISDSFSMVPLISLIAPTPGRGLDASNLLTDLPDRRRAPDRQASSPVNGSSATHDPERNYGPVWGRTP